MAYWNRNRDRNRDENADDFGGGGRETRGMFGYEGEGFMRGAGRDINRGAGGRLSEFGRGAGDFMRGGGEFAGGDRSGWDRDWSPRGRYADDEFGRGGRDRNEGGRNDFDRGAADRGGDNPMSGGYGDFNRGDYQRGFGGGAGSGQGHDTDRGTPMGRQSFRGRGPKGYQRSDERIREDVCERLELDDYVDASDIEVQVSGATVTLTGSVSDRGAKRRVEDIAESVRGVRDVQNNLRIGGEGNKVGNG